MLAVVAMTALALHLPARQQMGASLTRRGFGLGLAAAALPANAAIFKCDAQGKNCAAVVD